MKRNAIASACLILVVGGGSISLVGCQRSPEPPSEPFTRSDGVQRAAPDGPAAVLIPGAQRVTDSNGNIVQLDLRGCTVTDQDLRGLTDLQYLKVLKLSGRGGKCRVTDAGLESLGKL